VKCSKPIDCASIPAFSRIPTPLVAGGAEEGGGHASKGQVSRGGEGGKGNSTLCSLGCQRRAAPTEVCYASLSATLKEISGAVSKWIRNKYRTSRAAKEKDWGTRDGRGHGCDVQTLLCVLLPRAAPPRVCEGRLHISCDAFRASPSAVHHL
jgi:hypothetical protein